MARKRSYSKRRRTSRRKGAKANNLIWGIVIVACFGLVAGIGFVSQKLIAKATVDEVTLCHAEGVHNVVSILLDLTDPLSETQQARLKAIIAREVSDASVDTMIALGVVSEASGNWGAKFAKCKPATGVDANGLYENPAIIAERYQSEFIVPIQVTLESMMSGETENQSPIMEALQSLVSETPYFSDTRGNRTIIVVSDMLQHSNNLSFYRNQGWDYFAKQNGPQRLAGNLSGVSIQILRVPRLAGNIPSNDIVEDFWVRYFDKQGSHPPSVTSLGDL